tara:strand:+ start:140 stop:475 length:336 start_codon:yes stop_codon:yes gene_type:complete
MAREALAQEDKILSENYFQHADHFTRVQNEQESIRMARINSSTVESTKPIKTEAEEIKSTKIEAEEIKSTKIEAEEIKSTKIEVQKVKEVSIKPDIKKIIKTSAEKKAATS